MINNQQGVHGEVNLIKTSNLNCIEHIFICTISKQNDIGHKLLQLYIKHPPFDSLQQVFALTLLSTYDFVLLF
jgi:hypothetical protein